MCISVLMFTSVGVGHKPKVDVGCLPPSFSTFTEAGFLFEPRACQFLASLNLSLGSPFASTSGGLRLQVATMLAQLFLLWVLESPTQGTDLCDKCFIR